MGHIIYWSKKMKHEYGISEHVTDWQRRHVWSFSLPVGETGHAVPLTLDRKRPCWHFVTSESAPTILVLRSDFKFYLCPGFLLVLSLCQAQSFLFSPCWVATTDRLSQLPFLSHFWVWLMGESSRRLEGGGRNGLKYFLLYLFPVPVSFLSN